MSSTLKGKVTDMGHTVAEAAKTVGETVAKGTESAVDFIKDKTGMGGPAEGTNLGVAGIKEHMHVIASCGKQVGVVDHLEGEALKLTKKDSRDGQHHFIPLNWIERVDSHVHLTKNSKEAEDGWKSDATSCGCGA
jgi:hypothetical protein